MHQPWGLSGPQFLGVFFAGIIASVLIPVITARVLGLLPGLQGTGRKIDDYEVAYLKGGPDRVAEVALVELSSRGALRVSSAGKVRVADPGASWTGSQASQQYGLRPEDFPGESRTSRIRQRIRNAAGFPRIPEKLQAEGLLLSPSQTVALRVVTVAVVLGLVGTGIARLIEGTSNHRPASLLVIFLMLAAIVSATRMRALFKGPHRTARGTAVLRTARRQGAPRMSADPAVKANLAGQGALLAVALAGFGAVTDEALRSALSAGMPSAGSGGGGGGCGGGGGGGCGGGGGGCGG